MEEEWRSGGGGNAFSSSRTQSEAVVRIPEFLSARSGRALFTLPSFPLARPDGQGPLTLLRPRGQKIASPFDDRARNCTRPRASPANHRCLRDRIHLSFAAPLLCTDVDCEDSDPRAGMLQQSTRAAPAPPTIRRCHLFSHESRRAE